MEHGLEGAAAEARRHTEARIRDACERGEHATAATLAVRGYGQELLGFLFALLRDAEHASEVFAMASEDMWRGLPSFRWQCSFRTWCYALARNAAARFVQRDLRKQHRQRPLSDVAELAEEVRSTTAAYLKSNTRSQFAALRDALSTEENLLLILRLERELSWIDIVRVCDPAGSERSDEELKDEAARLRKRFQRLRQRLREQARSVGLLGGRV
jgi:RNA polymerase sigma-70 factor (ECF subfamily)